MRLGITAILKTIPLSGAVLCLALTSVCTNDRPLHLLKKLESRFEPFAFEGKEYSGYFTAPQGAAKSKALLILVDGRGFDEFWVRKSAKFASLGYVVYAAEVTGKSSDFPRANGGHDQALRGGDPQSFAHLVNNILAVLQSHKAVDSQRVFAVGFCLGGTALLHYLAKGGGALRAASVVYPTQIPASESEILKIRVKIQLQFAENDAFLPDSARDTFLLNLSKARLDYFSYVHLGASHEFARVEEGGPPARRGVSTANKDSPLSSDIAAATRADRFIFSFLQEF